MRQYSNQILINYRCCGRIYCNTRKFCGDTMVEVITLEVPEKLALQLKNIAIETNRRLEDMLVEWIGQITTIPPLATLSNDEILKLCDLQMDNEQQTKLSDLLARNREGILTDLESYELDQLMTVYRQGLIRKASALQIAVKRGLKPPLNQQYDTTTYPS